MKSISLSHFIATSMFAVLAATGQNASAQAGNIYSRDQVQFSGSVQEGIVLQVNTRQAEATWQARSVGASIGSTVGYAAARNNNGTATVLTSMLGGLIGERVANHVATDQAQEIIVQMNTGSGHRLVSVVQPTPADTINAGDSVLLIQTAGQVRVVKRQF